MLRWVDLVEAENLALDATEELREVLFVVADEYTRLHASHAPDMFGPHARNL